MKIPYRGYVIAKDRDDDSYKVYTKDEYSFGNGYRYPEYDDIETVEIAKELIDGLISDNDIEEATEPSNIGQYKRDSLDIINEYEEDDIEECQLDQDNIDAEREIDSYEAEFGADGYRAFGKYPYDKFNEDDIIDSDKIR